MSVAEVLKAARAAGIRVHIDGGDLDRQPRASTRLSKRGER